MQFESSETEQGSEGLCGTAATLLPPGGQFNLRTWKKRRPCPDPTLARNDVWNPAYRLV